LKRVKIDKFNYLINILILFSHVSSNFLSTSDVQYIKYLPEIECKLE
jgi:hypothetical protein